ncbi:histidine kinase [Nocardioides euryhalodurans]|uniref:Oxygen sensor histidine kinase NreB n=1 Tax=Nocardioides euryhalodurans TaxID=2518370 RepID=A0A4P7GLR4_9ACTN|nr:histidine kinase [Nocardioides euryhalodurans]QBR93088.1 sensor histidine kinase [Nocardioides euryhalodurans]
MTTARGRRWAAVGLASLTVTAFVLTVVLDTLEPVGGEPFPLAPDPGWVFAANGVVLGALALVVLHHDPRHGFGWALSWLGLFWALDGLAQAYVRVGLSADEAWPGMTFALWFLLRFTSFLPVTIAALLLIFPTGRFLPGRWGLAGKVSLALLCGICVLVIVAPATGFLDVAVPPGVDLEPTTVPVSPGIGSTVAGGVRVLAVLLFLVPMATVVVRYRRATGVERDRMRWLLWAVVVMALTILLTTVVRVPQLEHLVTFVIMVLPAGAMTVAIVRPDLVPIDDLFGTTLVYGSLSVIVVGVDLAVLAGVTELLGDALAQQQVVLLVLLLSALLYAPLRDRLWRGVRRLVLGERDNPYDVVAGLASTLETTGDGADQLAAVARAVATAFGVPYVRVEVDRGGGERLIATHGTAPAETRTLPITYRGDAVGRLVLPARGLRSRLSRRDEQLLGDLVRQAATAVRTGRLAAELQESRERLVVAREEERRRIRRDLHDGLGPALSGVVFRLESARLLVERDPAAAADHIEATSEHVQEVVADVRRLVHDLRPPALDDRGLVGALSQLGERVATGGLAVRVEATDLGPLPAAVEVAAYRIAGEALTNVARHAHASLCVVGLAVTDGDLVVEVVDDGRGIPADAEAGVGLVSLRERAAELGGNSEVTCPPGGGTVVRARLPMGSST